MPNGQLRIIIISKYMAIQYICPHHAIDPEMHFIGAHMAWHICNFPSFCSVHSYYSKVHSVQNGQRYLGRRSKNIKCSKSYVRWIVFFMLLRTQQVLLAILPCIAINTCINEMREVSYEIYHGFNNKRVLRPKYFYVLTLFHMICYLMCSKK